MKCCVCLPAQVLLQLHRAKSNTPSVKEPWPHLQHEIPPGNVDIMDVKAAEGGDIN